MQEQKAQESSKKESTWRAKEGVIQVRRPRDGFDLGQRSRAVLPLAMCDPLPPLVPAVLHTCQEEEKRRSEEAAVKLEEMTQGHKVNAAPRAGSIAAAKRKKLEIVDQSTLEESTFQSKKVIINLLFELIIDSKQFKVKVLRIIMGNLSYLCLKVIRDSALNSNT